MQTAADYDRIRENETNVFLDYQFRRQQRDELDLATKVTNRANNILNDFDYCGDLVVTIMESYDGDKAIWNLRKASTPEQVMEAHKALLVLFAEAALMVANSEFKRRGEA